MENTVKVTIRRFQNRKDAASFAEKVGSRVERCPATGTNSDGFFKFQVFDYGVSFLLSPFNLHLVFECFPSLAIWPTYCIHLSTFCSVYPDLSDFNLSDSNQEVLYIPGAPAFRSFHS